MSALAVAAVGFLIARVRLEEIGRHVIITSADRRVLARVPNSETESGANRFLDVISAAPALTSISPASLVAGTTGALTLIGFGNERPVGTLGKRAH